MQVWNPGIRTWLVSNSDQVASMLTTSSRVKFSSSVFLNRKKMSAASSSRAVASPNRLKINVVVYEVIKPGPDGTKVTLMGF